MDLKCATATCTSMRCAGQHAFKVEAAFVAEHHCEICSNLLHNDMSYHPSVNMHHLTGRRCIFCSVF